jgi:hypothetical protein
MKSVIHRITGICSYPEKNFKFYIKILGLLALPKQQ